MATYTLDVIAYTTGEYIDMKNSDAQLVATVASGVGQFRVIALIVENTDVTGLVTAAIVNVGTNASSYNNICSGIIAPNGNDQQKLMNIKENAIVVGEGASVYIKPTSVSVATEHLARVSIVGHHAT